MKYVITLKAEDELERDLFHVHYNKLVRDGLRLPKIVEELVFPSRSNNKYKHRNIRSE